MGMKKYTCLTILITSLKHVNELARALRTHWSIENGLHYSLELSL